MQLQINLPGENPKEGIIHLKNYIDKSSIDGLENTEIERAPHQQGQMGVGAILDSLKLVIEAAEKPLTELVKCLYKYVSNYRTTITIPTKDGAPIKLEHGRSMTADELKKLVVAIQNANSTGDGKN